MGWAIAGGVLGLVIMFLAWLWLRNWATANAGGSSDSRIGTRPRRLAGIPEEVNPEVKAAPAMEVMTVSERPRPGADPVEGEPDPAPAAPAVVAEPAAPPVEAATSEGTAEEADLVVVEIIGYDQGGDEVGESILIANRGETPVDISGWSLADKGNIHGYVFPEMTLEPGTELRIHMWEGEDSDRNLYVGGRVRWWNNTGDVAHLYDASGALRHHFVIELEK